MDKNNSNDIRKKLKTKYYLEWLPKNNIFNKNKNEITNELLVNMYNEYIEKLNEFINEISEISKNITKKDFTLNLRQIGGYERCIKNYPDKGWSTKYHHYIQAYKELMVDFIFYEPLGYDDLSIKEIDIMKEMACFLIKQAEKNKSELLK